MAIPVAILCLVAYGSDTLIRREGPVADHPELPGLSGDQRENGRRQSRPDELEPGFRFWGTASTGESTGPPIFPQFEAELDTIAKRWGGERRTTLFAYREDRDHNRPQETDPLFNYLAEHYPHEERGQWTLFLLNRPHDSEETVDRG